MFAINSTYGRNDSQKALIFKMGEDADAAAAILENSGSSSAFIEITDDFGQWFSVRRDAITAWSYENLDKTAEMQVDIAIHNQRVQARAQSAVMNDPQIRAAMAMSGMQQPMGGLLQA